MKITIDPRTEFAHGIEEIEADAFYNQIIDSDTGMMENSVQYQVIFEILHNECKVAQFLSLYQLMMDLTEKKGRALQKNVTEYIYKSKERYSKVEFFIDETRDKKTDSLTHLRNELAHTNYNLSNERYLDLRACVTDEVISSMLKILNQMILEKSEEE